MDVAAVGLPRVILFELGIVAQVFGRPARLGDAAGDYTLTTCTARPGRVANHANPDQRLLRLFCDSRVAVIRAWDQGRYQHGDGARVVT
jgi:hypothetical protein